MNISKAIATVAAGLALAPTMSSAGTIGGVQYASQYDYREFFAVADHRDFHVGLAGNQRTLRDDVRPARQVGEVEALAFVIALVVFPTASRSAIIC